MKTINDNGRIHNSEIIHIYIIPVKRKPFCLHPYRLVIFICLSLFTISSLSQDSLKIPQITVHDTTCTVGAFLKILEKQTSFSFSYNAGIINEKERVTVNAENEPVTEVLQRVLNDPSLDFKIIGRHLVIYQPRYTLSINPENLSDSVYFFEIRGRIYDKAGKQPLPFTNVYLAGKGIGTISNEEGEFLLKLSSDYLADTMNISHMGYKQFAVPVSRQVNTDMKYFLELDIISIQEVIIRLQSPINILQLALTGIPDNYPLKPSLLTTFYRETVKKGNRYMIVSEAILEMFKRSYHNFLLEDQVKIIKGRKKQDINPGDTVILKLKAGLNSMLLLDVIKYMPDFMNEAVYYDYVMADIIVENGRENYVIEFSPKEHAYEAYYTGRIFIDVRDLSVVRVKFSVDPARLDDVTHLFVLRKPAYLKIKMLSANYNIAYRKISNKYYLHSIHCETDFRVRLGKQLFGSVYTTSVEMAVTQIDTTDVDRFRYRDLARTDDVFNDQITGYDELFWGEYNFIRPEDPLEKAIEKLENATLELLNE